MGARSNWQGKVSDIELKQIAPDWYLEKNWKVDRVEGSDLVANGDFESDNATINGVTRTGGDILITNRSTEQANGGTRSLKVIADSSSINPYINWLDGSNMGLTAGKTYRVSVDVFLPAGQTMDSIYLRVYDNSGSAQDLLPGSINKWIITNTSDASYNAAAGAWYTLYGDFIDDDCQEIRILARNSDGYNVDNEYFYIDNLSVKELSDYKLIGTGATGNNAQTKEWTNIWDGISGDDANWEVFGTNTKTEEDGAVKITYVDNASGAKIFLRDANDLSEDLTVDKWYRITYDVKTNSGSKWRPVVNDGNGSGPLEYTGPEVTSTEFVENFFSFKAKHATNAYLYTSGMAAGEEAFIKNIRIESWMATMGHQIFEARLQNGNGHSKILTPGKSYKLTFDWTRTSGYIDIVQWNGITSNLSHPAGGILNSNDGNSGSFVGYFTATSTKNQIKFVQNNVYGFVGTIENIVVEEFAGGGEELGFSEINMSNIEHKESMLRNDDGKIFCNFTYVPDQSGSTGISLLKNPGVYGNIKNIKVVDITPQTDEDKWTANTSATDRTSTIVSINNNYVVDTTVSATQYFYIHGQIYNGVKYAVSAANFTATSTDTNITVSTAEDLGTAGYYDNVVKFTITVDYDSGNKFPTTNSDVYIVITEQNNGATIAIDQ